MNTNPNYRIVRRPGGLFGVGTTGWLIVLYYWLWETACKLRPKRDAAVTGNNHARTVLAIETAQSSRHARERLGPGHELVSLPEADTFVLPPRSLRELAEEALRHQATRRYGEIASRIPNGSSEDGVGGVALGAYLSGLASFHEIASLVEARILAQRDRARVDKHHEQGERFALAARNVQLIVGNFAGGTYPALALLVAYLVAFYSQKYGVPSEIILCGTTPSALSGGDLVCAEAAYTLFMRQAVIAQQQPKLIRFGTFQDEVLRPTEPIVHRIIPFGPSTGRITVSTRKDVAAQIATAAWLLLDGAYGPFADAAFRDFEKSDQLDTRYGFRGFSRLGVGILRTDQVRNRAIAQAAGEALAASEILGPDAN
jgi:hypothetical protein